MAGDEQVPPDPVAQRVHGLTDITWHVPADIYDRVPASPVQRPVVARVPVADEPGQSGKQVGPGLAPAEQGHLGAGAQGILHDGAAHEGCAAQNQDSHIPHPTAPAAARPLRRLLTGQSDEQIESIAEPSPRRRLAAASSWLTLLVSPRCTACRSETTMPRSALMAPILARTDWWCASACAAFSCDCSVCMSVVKRWMSVRSAEALPWSRLIALSSAVILLVSARASCSAAMHPGSAAGDLAATTTTPIEPAPTSSATMMPTIDKTRPPPARAFDLTRPRIEKIKPSGQTRIASTIPATAKPLRRFTGWP